MATTTVNRASTVNNVNSMGRCQVCGSMRQTSNVTFHRNIGMLVLRQTRSIQGNMCKTCAGKKFWDFTIKNIVFGPWGVISLIVTPIYLVTNTISYLSARQKLRNAIE
jgi:hypothetical protein